MRKVIGFFLVLVLLAGCSTVRITRPGYSYVKTVCVNPTSPVVQRVVVNSRTGNATAISIVIVNSNIN